jgi:hypothetical protein
MPNFGELKEGTYRMLYLFILSCLIFISSIDRGIPSLAAASFGPATATHTFVVDMTFLFLFFYFVGVPPDSPPKN